MMPETDQHVGARWVPTPLAQLGDYEADLFKLGYFGWLNLATIGTEVWLQILSQGVAD